MDINTHRTGNESSCALLTPYEFLYTRIGKTSIESPCTIITIWSSLHTLPLSICSTYFYPIFSYPILISWRSFSAFCDFPPSVMGVGMSRIVLQMVTGWFASLIHSILALYFPLSGRLYESNCVSKHHSPLNGITLLYISTIRTSLLNKKFVW